MVITVWSRKESFDMYNKLASKIATEMVDKMIEYFGNRVTEFVIAGVINDPSHRAFSITFKAYNYFVIRLNYNKGRFGCCVDFGEYGISLDNSQKWWDTADFDVFFKELKQEIELRIPDKFLEAKGWL